MKVTLTSEGSLQYWQRNFRHTTVPMNVNERHCSVSRTKVKGNYHQVQSSMTIHYRHISLLMLTRFVTLVTFVQHGKPI